MQSQCECPLPRHALQGYADIYARRSRIGILVFDHGIIII